MVNNTSILNYFEMYQISPTIQTYVCSKYCAFTALSIGIVKANNETIVSCTPAESNKSFGSIL